MIKQIDIITAPFTKIGELQEKGYLCVSIIGKVYGDYAGKENLGRIRGLNIFRHRDHLKAKDYYACKFLFTDSLEKKGIEKITRSIHELLEEHNKTKIALCGYGKGDDFCYRHILSDFLQRNNVEVTELTEVDLDIQKEYWKQNHYKTNGHDNLSNEFVGYLLENSIWTFAKTMPKNPHYYILRKKFGDNATYLSIVKHIRYFGKAEIFQGILYRVFYYNGYRYWDCPYDTLDADVDLINRKPIEK